MPTIGLVSRSMIDYGSEIGTARMYMPELTSANFLAQSTKIAALQAAIQAICLSALSSYRLANLFHDPTRVKSGAQWSQREMKWLIQYRDTVTGSQHSLAVPCADFMTHLDAGDRAHADMEDAGHVAAFVTAFEAVCLSPNGNAVDVTEITLVGRNL